MSIVVTAAKSLIAVRSSDPRHDRGRCDCCAAPVARWIAAEPDMMVAACLRTGRQAVDKVEECDPDVVVLDVDMPELDGISALPLLLRKRRDLVVIMASTLTRRSAEISLRALSLGAADYVPKPEAAPDAATSAAFQRELIDKIRHLGRRGRLIHPETTAPTTSRPAPMHRAQRHRTPKSSLSGCGRSRCQYRGALLIGSSTGGPQALTSLVGQIGATMERAPVLITQHMPPTFTTVLAEHLPGSADEAYAKPNTKSRWSPAAFMWRRAAGICGSDAVATAHRRLRSATIRRSISASLRSIRCFPRRRKYGARPVWR